LAGRCAQRLVTVLARRRPRPATAAARAAGRFGGARRAAGALAGRCVRRPYCSLAAACNGHRPSLFCSAQAEACDEEHKELLTAVGSAWLAIGALAGWPMCAAASGRHCFGSAEAAACDGGSSRNC
jgi:hypothetical protein